jgi:hypothetical protein
VVILVDSGSSHSIINVKLAPGISGVSALFKPVRVQVANGNIIQCSSEFKHISWSIQDHQFILDLKVLPLPYYDMILGMDCLDCHSPMKVEWLNKWIIISKDSVPIQLHGLQPFLPKFSLVEVLWLFDDIISTASSCLAQPELPAHIQ